MPPDAAAAAPENTLAAFERAIQDGADYVELDVMETAYGQVVVFHDKDYMKVAGVPVKVWEATYEELAQIDIGSHFSPTYCVRIAIPCIVVICAKVFSDVPIRNAR